MTSKEKAIELTNKFVFKSVFDMNQSELKEARIKAKKCALIAVDEMLSHTMNCDYRCAGYPYEFWIEVKQEIEAL